MTEKMSFQCSEILALKRNAQYGKIILLVVLNLYSHLKFTTTMGVT